MPLLVVDRLSKSFGAHRVLNSISLSVLIIFGQLPAARQRARKPSVFPVRVSVMTG